MALHFCPTSARLCAGSSGCIGVETQLVVAADVEVVVVATPDVAAADVAAATQQRRAVVAAAVVSY